MTATAITTEGEVTRYGYNDFRVGKNPKLTDACLKELFAAAIPAPVFAANDVTRYIIDVNSPAFIALKAEYEAECERRYTSPHSSFASFVAESLVGTLGTVTAVYCARTESTFELGPMMHETDFNGKPWSYQSYLNLQVTSEAHEVKVFPTPVAARDAMMARKTTLKERGFYIQATDPFTKRGGNLNSRCCYIQGSVSNNATLKRTSEYWTVKQVAGAADCKCGRCHGQGYINHPRMNGLCFKCWGSGDETRPFEKPSQQEVKMMMGGF